MSNIAVARINSFASEATLADLVPQSDQLITLTYGQLSEIIRGAVHQALEEVRQDAQEHQISTDRDIQALRDEIEVLKHELSKVAGQTSDALDDIQEAFDKMNLQTTVINQLSQKVHGCPLITGPANPGAKTEARLKRMDTILKDMGGSLLLSEVRKRMELSPSEMTRLLRSADLRKYEVFYRQGNRRQKVIRLKVQIR